MNSKMNINIPPFIFYSCYKVTVGAICITITAVADKGIILLQAD